MTVGTPMSGGGAAAAAISSYYCRQGSSSSGDEDDEEVRTPAPATSSSTAGGVFSFAGRHRPTSLGGGGGGGGRSAKNFSGFGGGFKARFEGLFWQHPPPPSSSSSSATREALSPHHGVMSEEEWKAKEDAIVDVLRGRTADGAEDGAEAAGAVVDLWKLRELALSKGGLLCPSLRRRAWPTLVQAHEQVLGVAGSGGAGGPSSLPVVAPSAGDVQALKHGCSKTIWAIEEFLLASREQRRAQEENVERSIALHRQRNRKVKFDLPDKLDPTGVEEEELGEDGRVPPAAAIVSPTSQDGDDDEVVFGDGFLDDGTGGCDGDDPSFCVSENTSSTSFTFSSRVVRWRKASTNEQKILYNIVLNLLRTEAPPSEHFEDDRYHYYPGLQDLCALMMMNLESPSLTSLVLSKLATAHLRDALRQDRVVMDSAISFAFMPLLEAVDPGLHAHLRRNGLTLPTFARQWISCWFSQDVPDAAVASRLLDVFLVSHPLMPMYMAVALLSKNRKDIINGACDLSALYASLRRMPFEKFFDEDSRMVHVEDIISTALSYMRKVSVDTLVEMVKNRFSDSRVVPSIAMFLSAPAWCLVDHAPSDYALLERARALRAMQEEVQYKDAEEEQAAAAADGDSSPSGGDASSQTNDDELIARIRSAYPLAAAAAGYAQKRGGLSNKKPAVLVLLFAALVLFLFATSTATAPQSTVQDKAVPLPLSRRGAQSSAEKIRKITNKARVKVSIKQKDRPKPVVVTKKSTTSNGALAPFISTFSASPRPAVAKEAPKIQEHEYAGGALLVSFTEWNQKVQIMLFSVRTQLDKLGLLWKKFLRGVVDTSQDSLAFLKSVTLTVQEIESWP